MQDGKKWKLIGPASTRKAPKVQAVFDIMDEKGITTLKKLVDEILQQRVVGMGIIRRKSRANGKAKSRATRKDIVYITQPQPQPQPQPVATGSGRYRKPKAASRLKPIQEDEEEIRTIIKPARNHLPYLDLNNDVYLINKIR